MTFDEVDALARAKWDATPVIRYGFADYTAFLQTEVIHHNVAPDMLVGMIDRRARVDELRAEHALERLRAVRDPLLAKPASPIYDRQGDRLTIWLYGRLAFGEGKAGECGGARIVDAIVKNAHAKAIFFRISSPGGSTDAHDEVVDAIRAYRGRTLAVVDHFACSAAAQIAIACDRMVMRQNSLVMFHRPRGMASGDCHVMDGEARRLRFKANGYRKEIMRRAPWDAHTTIAAAIEDERYIGAEEALSLGLCHAIAPSLLGSDELIAATPRPQETT